MILRNNANLSTGGTATDVTDDVHPEVAARAVEAAQMVGLRHLRRRRGLRRACCNRSRSSTAASSKSTPRRACACTCRRRTARAARSARRSIDTMFAPGDDGRIPVVAVTGTNGKTTTVRLIAHLLTASGLRTGMTNTDGVYIEGRQHRQRRLQRPAQRAQRAAAPRRRRGRVRNGARRHAARRPGLRPLQGRRGHQHRQRATTWA